MDDIPSPTLIVVSGKKTYLERIGYVLALWGYVDILLVKSSVEAIAAFERLEGPAIFLTDYVIGTKDGLDGIRLSKYLVERSVFKRFSVACGIIFERQNQELFEEALEVAEFYYTKRPEHSGEKYNLGPVLRKHLKKTEKSLRNFQFERTDHSTGMLSKKEVETRWEVLCRLARRDHMVTSVAVLDIDDFKMINERYGHAIGDEVIYEVSKRLQIRPGDIAFRSYSKGDEFVVVLPRTEHDEALQVVERIRGNFEHSDLVLKDGTRIRISVSIGVACLPYDHLTSSPWQLLVDLIKVADSLMFQEKHAKKLRPKLGGR